MNFIYCKKSMIVAFCSLTMLSMAPQAFAASSGGVNAPQQSAQQTKRITGVVSDAMGPIIGASVAVKGTTNGTSTDNDGQFSLNVSPGQTLVVTYVGYLTKEVTVGQQNNYNIFIEENHQLLDEVVVVGYGTMKKSDISGSSVSLGESAVKGSIITRLTNHCKAAQPVLPLFRPVALLALVHQSACVVPQRSTPTPNLSTSSTV